MSHSSLFKLRHLPHAAVALMAVGASGAAFAQAGNAVTGENLYRNTRLPITGFSPSSCGDCHGMSTEAIRVLARGRDEAGMRAAISGAIGANRGGMSAFSSWVGNSQLNDVAAFIATIPAAPPPPPFGGGGGTVVATPTVSPVSPVLFSSTAVGSRVSMPLTLTNAATSPVNFATQVLTVLPGGDASDFLVAQTPPTGMQACSGTLQPGMSCGFTVIFEPKGNGTRAVSWAVSFTNAQARTVQFQGMGMGTPSPAPAPAPTPSPAPAPAPTPTPAPAPSPSPAPTPAPAPSPSAAGADSGGGGAIAPLAAIGLPGLLGIAILRRRRSR